MKDRDELITNWLKKANRDLIAAQHELTFPFPITESVCFHSQQAVEKFIKAYLVYQGVSFTKTHEIGELITKAELLDNEISKLKEEADTLTDYATTVRYPEELLEPSIDDSREALRIAEMVKIYILGKIPRDIF
jgi:HEPN domain-containing protein